MAKSIVVWTRKVIEELLADDDLVQRMNEHTGSVTEATRDILVPEALKRGYKAVEVPID